jgi:hypothetical protein
MQVETIRKTLTEIYATVVSYDLETKILLQEEIEIGPTLCAFAFRRDLASLVDAVERNLFVAVNYGKTVTTNNPNNIDIQDQPLTDPRILFVLEIILQDYISKIPADLQKSVSEITCRNV